MLAVVWNAQVKTSLWWLSNVLVMLGSASYTYVKQMEMKEEKRAQEAAAAANASVSGTGGIASREPSDGKP